MIRVETKIMAKIITPSLRGSKELARFQTSSVTEKGAANKKAPTICCATSSKENLSGLLFDILETKEDLVPLSELLRDKNIPVLQFRGRIIFHQSHLTRAYCSEHYLKFFY